MRKLLLLSGAVALLLTVSGSNLALAGADQDHKDQAAAGNGYSGQKDKWGCPCGRPSPEAGSASQFSDPGVAPGFGGPKGGGGMPQTHDAQ